ncbi:response regulator [Ensifer sesbaniae]|jgi:DNA-binding response OmpR family regulator|uniref:response regulator n=2 Tax=Ensifer sesbaniae TaxID=1214071 RepID=UPI001AED21A8|nr:response regulator [Ensifer sesbaniae]
MIMSAILAGRRILVVEDEMLVAMSIEDTLIDAGGEVVGPAPTVGRALGLLQDEAKIDAVVLDMNLQGHSGLPVADACDERSIPFLILSGYGDTALSGTRHAAPILSKPFASAVLVKALTTLFDGSRS